MRIFRSVNLKQEAVNEEWEVVSDQLSVVSH